MMELGRQSTDALDRAAYSPSDVVPVVFLQLVLGDYQHIPFNPLIASEVITITVKPTGDGAGPAP